MLYTCRSLTNINENAILISDANGDAFRCFEGLRKSRSTHNRLKNKNIPFSVEAQHLCREKGDPYSAHQQYENMMVRRDIGNGDSARTRNDYSNDQDSMSHQDGCTPPVAQTGSHVRPELRQSVEGPPTVNTVIKRQRQRSTSRNHGECSTSAFDDPEIVFLGSSGVSMNLRSRRNQNRHGVGILDPDIELDEFSPEVGHSAPQNTVCSSNIDSGARARQVEADELLARELQEQLYNEVPRVRVGEIDAHIALTLQQAEDTRQAFSSGSDSLFHPSSSLIPNLRRQSQSRSSRSPIIRRGPQARVPSSTRLAQLRSRFRGQSRTVSSRERNSLFPPNVDVEMRMHILEAMEAVSDMSSFLQAPRDFNENDYEMLLALDENNHHIGVSFDQMNGLPQSTVQTDNFDEVCAICLETPTIGDTIRHLPCLHKFHKDCIDPWLRRKTSCPVCKSSIT
ncbi:unnamed protein product [Ilex paraguariensis]|uniref:RING-type domain-containing protein n=1 Tax=Ilex paraguariensis TaxID=185542 RepID=A0ABC8SGC0_9AQUA